MSQSPDLTPTLESTGSEAMQEEGLSPNQTNKPKKQPSHSTLLFLLTPEDRLELKVVGLKSLESLVQAPILSPHAVRLTNREPSQASVSLSRKWRQCYPLKGRLPGAWAPEVKFTSLYATYLTRLKLLQL